MGSTWSILGMDISEVTLQVDTYGLGFRAVRSWGDTLGVLCGYHLGIGFVVG